MGYRIISMRGGRYGRKSSNTDEFYEAMDMAKEGLEKVCELAEEMREQYGDRHGDYGRRENWDEMEDYGERRRRDSRGRYM
jgi:hypothetical protein